MSLHEIVLPQTKPETEWVRGRPLRKVSPTYSHARLQALIVMALTEWADAGTHGRVAPEWRFRVTPPVGLTRPLVPDVAYLSYTALAQDAPSDAFEVPHAAPTVAVEIVSPDDRPIDVVDKIRTYLAAGSSVVIVVDPRTCTFETYDASGRRSYIAGDVFSHEALPGFALDIGNLFVRANR
jgi:Uma2 family endonuclease